MFCVLTSYLSDKLEYVCCFCSYVSHIFHDVDADTFNTTVFFNHFIIDHEFLILYLFTACNLRELKLPTFVNNKVYCIAL